MTETTQAVLLHGHMEHRFKLVIERTKQWTLVNIFFNVTTIQIAVIIIA